VDRHVRISMGVSPQSWRKRSCPNPDGEGDMEHDLAEAERE